MNVVLLSNEMPSAWSSFFSPPFDSLTLDQSRAFERQAASFCLLKVNLSHHHRLISFAFLVPLVLGHFLSFLPPLPAELTPRGTLLVCISSGPETRLVDIPGTCRNLSFSSRRWEPMTCHKDSTYIYFDILEINETCLTGLPLWHSQRTSN